MVAANLGLIHPITLLSDARFWTRL